MDIREKVLAGIICIILLFLVILIGISSSVTQRNYGDLEASRITDHTNLVVDNIREETVLLSTLTRSWAESDGAYAYAQGRDPDYIQKTFFAQTFFRSDINFLVITNADGRVLYTRGFNDTTPQFEPVPGQIISEITLPDHPMMDLSSGYTGLLNVPGSPGPVLIASSPILRSDQSGPPAGILIVGRSLGTDEMDRFRSPVIPALSITTAETGDYGAIAGSSPAGKGSEVRITPLGEDSIRGETVLEDYHGVRNIRVAIVTDRPIHEQGKNALLGLVLVELATGLVVGLFIIILLDRIVLSRLQLINRDINGIIASGDISGRVRVRDNDEISQLAHAMNLMLANTEEAQARIVGSETKLRHAESVAKFGYWELDMTTNRVTASDGAREIYGIGGRELTLPEIQAVPLPQCRSGLDRLLQELVEEGKPYNTEFLIRRSSDNAIRSIHSIAEYNPEKKVVFGVIQDITDRKQAENALRESEERYRSLTDSLPEFVLVHRNGAILYANAAVAGAAGLSQDDLSGRSIFGFIAPESRAIMVEKNRQRSLGEPVEPFEAQFQFRNGQKTAGFVNETIIRYRGEPAFLTIITDITGRKAMEQALSVANRKLHMLSSITRHDIRNKILGLRSWISIAEMSAHDEGEITLFRQLEDIARTIDEQLEFTREYQTMGMKAPQWIPVKGAIDRVKTQMNLGDIRVIDESEGLEVFADPLFEKVFYNLFDNAIRYGETIAAIRIRYQQQDTGDLILIVEDDGAGIPADEKCDIFERGFGRNTGLGLFMIREILGITGITIRETGIPGEGARFEMLVPEGTYRLSGSPPGEGR